MDRAPDLLTKTGVGVGVIKTELMDVEESELMNSEAEYPGDVGPVDRIRFDFLGVFLSCSTGRGHGVIFKYRREWAHL